MMQSNSIQFNPIRLEHRSCWIYVCVNRSRCPMAWSHHKIPSFNCISIVGHFNCKIAKYNLWPNNLPQTPYFEQTNKHTHALIRSLNVSHHNKTKKIHFKLLILMEKKPNPIWFDSIWWKSNWVCLKIPRV